MRGLSELPSCIWSLLLAFGVTLPEATARAHAASAHVHKSCCQSVRFLVALLLPQEVAGALLLRVSGCTSKADRAALSKEWLSFRLEGLPETHDNILTERCTEGEGVKMVSRGACLVLSSYFLLLKSLLVPAAPQPRSSRSQAVTQPRPQPRFMLCRLSFA
jgi:hypothetical protein